ncbi:MAG TPA: polymer-forming cytoskeletal protein [Longimicrobium sp.]|jgi:cytoskeletal protein CcmA (bactofilin family)|uniref:bactofilin family protein n=1 Tax=Longimicrobium sp. TaxID=2029185 RepID=UPI002ED907A2
MLGGKKSEAVLPRGVSGEASISIIGPGMNIIGNLSTDGTVRVEGRIEGTVRAGKAVLIGKGGEVVGDILTQDAVIGGRVHGTILAESRLEIQSTSVIDGQIRVRTGHLVVEEGAVHNGQTQMLDGSEALALPAPPRVDNSPQS